MRLSGGTPPAATYSADDPKIELEDVRYDTEEPANETKPAADAEPKIERWHRYSNTRIQEIDGKFLVEDKSYETLDDAKLALDKVPFAEKIK